MKSLSDRFKEFRRKKKPRKPRDSNPSQVLVAAKPKSPGITCPITSPQIPRGEDKTSFNRHNNVLKAEWKKKSHNQSLVDELMEQSFAMCWDDLHSESHDLDSVFDSYPFLQSSSHVS